MCKMRRINPKANKILSKDQNFLHCSPKLLQISAPKAKGCNFHIPNGTLQTIVAIVVVDLELLFVLVLHPLVPPVPGERVMGLQRLLHQSIL